MMGFHSCLWMNRMSLYILYYIFFIHFSVGGHLECFHVLAVVNITSVNIKVPVSFLIDIFIFFKFIPRRELLYHTVVLLLAF